MLWEFVTSYDLADVSQGSPLNRDGNSNPWSQFSEGFFFFMFMVSRILRCILSFQNVSIVASAGEMFFGWEQEGFKVSSQDGSLCAQLSQTIYTVHRTRLSDRVVFLGDTSYFLNEMPVPLRFVFSFSGKPSIKRRVTKSFVISTPWFWGC